jgi:hypothetical protein
VKFPISLVNLRLVSDEIDFIWPTVCALLNHKLGIRGRVIKVVDFKPLAPHRCGFESRKGLCKETIHVAYRMSVVLLRCLFVSETMHGRPPEARGLPSPVKLEHRHMTYESYTGCRYRTEYLARGWHATCLTLGCKTEFSSIGVTDR